MPGIKKEAALIFLLLALIYAYFFQEPGWNGNSRLGLTTALVREGRVTIDSYHESESQGLKTGDKSFYKGHYYTDKAIGASLIAAVFYLPIYWLPKFFGQTLNVWTVQYLLTLLSMGLPSAFSGSLMYWLCAQISGEKFRSFMVTMAIMLGTMLFPLSINFIGHPLAAALLFLGFVLIFQIRKMALSDLNTGHLFAIGIVLGFALITEHTTAIVIIPLVLYYLYTLWKKKTLRPLRYWLLPALGGLAPISLLFSYNLLAYGQPFVSGYQYLSNPFFQEAMSNGLMGISAPQLSVLFYQTIHPAQGIFWQSPVLLLTLPGTFMILRSKEYLVEGLLACTAFTGFLVMNSGYFMWWGGYSFAPRHIAPMLPFLCLPLIFLPKRLTPLLVIGTVVSVLQMFIVAASSVQVPQENFVALGHQPFFHFSAVYDYCLQQLINLQFGWNAGQELFGLNHWYSLVPILVTGLASAFGLGITLSRWDHRQEIEVGDL